MSPLVRLAQLQDIPQLIAIERSAAQLFLQQPAWRFLADGPVMSRQQHADFIQQQREWVAESASGEVAGFIAVLPQQQDWHIAELSVDAGWQRRGIGRRLIAEVAMQAKSQGAQRLTLTTFIDVPWNAPYYRRLGSSRSRPFGSTCRCGNGLLKRRRRDLLPVAAVQWNLHYRKY